MLLREKLNEYKAVCFDFRPSRKLFSRQILEKFSNIKFRENPSSGNGLFHADGRTDGQMDRWTDKRDEANSRFSEFVVPPETILRLNRILLAKTLQFKRLSTNSVSVLISNFGSCHQPDSDQIQISRNLTNYCVTQ